MTIPLHSKRGLQAGLTPTLLDAWMSGASTKHVWASLVPRPSTPPVWSLAAKLEV